MGALTSQKRQCAALGEAGRCRLSPDPCSEVWLCLNRTITLIAVCADYTVIIGLTIGEALLTPTGHGTAARCEPEPGRQKFPDWP